MSRSLAQLVPKIARTSLKGSTSKQVIVWQNWEHVLGSLASKVIPHKITKTPGGTLMVCTDSATALHIQYQEAQILERIASLAGAGQIVRIKSIKTPINQAQSAYVPTPTKATPPASTLEEALANLEKHLR